MITHITLRNFVIVDKLQLDLNPGMTVITGETGAGKSILFDAIGLAVGDRADSGMVRHGTDKADISITFNLENNQDAREWCIENDIDVDDECIIRRIITKEGRSKASINGYPATLQQLKQLGEQMLEIHGQHAHQSLLKPEKQRHLLDHFAGITAQVEQLERSYKHWKKLTDQQKRASAEITEREARLELLRYQVDELEKLGLQPGEYESLEVEHKRLSNAQALIELCQKTLSVLYENDETNAYGLLSHGLSMLESVNDMDNSIAPTLEIVQAASVQIQEATQDLRSYFDRLEWDPETLAELDDKITEAQGQARKHHVLPEELPSCCDRLNEELAQLESENAALENLDEAIDDAWQRYESMANEISTLRQSAAETLGNQVTEELETLNIKGGELNITLDALTPAMAMPYGMENILFTVRTNPGQPLSPLHKVVSGGELSRISLAIQVITAEKGQSPTLVFDEVDVGIGGATAAVVGQHLRRLAESAQILCVTHLPQVASQGHQHLRVQKQSEDNATASTMVYLKRSERVDEVARMLGGTSITANTKANAEEMLID
jgi:DNA repair protein RecN (Recombination protein N)